MCLHLFKFPIIRTHLPYIITPAMPPGEQPKRRLSTTSSRQPTTIQDIFIGVGLQLAPQPDISEGQEDPGRDLEYSAVIHDGTGIIDSETFHTTFHTYGKDEDGLAAEMKRVARDMLYLLRAIQTNRQVNVSDSLTFSHPDLFLWINIVVIWIDGFSTSSWIRLDWPPSTYRTSFRKA